MIEDSIMFEERTRRLQARLADAGLAVALITDDDSVYYFSGFYDYLHMEFGRPTILAVSAEDAPVLVTPTIELEMAQGMTWIGDIRPWQDGEGSEWRGNLQQLIEMVGSTGIGIERGSMPSLVRDFVDHSVTDSSLTDITTLIAELRMIKSEEELQLARHAGQVAMAMMRAGRDAIREGIPEYEVALATAEAGARSAAELLATHYDDAWMSPNTHFLQIMASGTNITMAHRRPTLRQITRGDPVFLCFCGMANFHRFKLGFDRTFWLGEIQDPRQAEIYEAAVASQRAALEHVRPGVLAEEVHAAYAEVIQAAGYEFPFRCGRATGFSFLERPQLVAGDRTALEPGMVFAIDGSVSVAGYFRAQVGDTIVVTEEGYEPITEFPKTIDDVVVG